MILKLDKPHNISATFERLRAKLATLGGILTGNEREGTISIHGASGKYTAEGDCIVVEITKKTLSIIPKKLIEKEIRAVFDEISG